MKKLGVSKYINSVYGESHFYFKLGSTQLLWLKSINYRKYGDFRWSLNWEPNNEFIANPRESFISAFTKLSAGEKSIDLSNAHDLSGLSFSLDLVDDWHSFTFMQRHVEKKIKKEGGITFYAGTSKEVIDAFAKLTSAEFSPKLVESFNVRYEEFMRDDTKYPISDDVKLFDIELYCDNGQWNKENIFAKLSGNTTFLTNAGLLKWVAENHAEKDKFVNSVDFDHLAKVMNQKIIAGFNLPREVREDSDWDGAYYGYTT